MFHIVRIFQSMLEKNTKGKKEQQTVLLKIFSGKISMGSNVSTLKNKSQEIFSIFVTVEQINYLKSKGKTC